jgi:hypothetical protein
MKILIDLHVKYPLFLSDFIETWIFSTNFGKSLNSKFHETPSIGSQVIQCGRREGQTDWQHMSKLLTGFGNFENAYG